MRSINKFWLFVALAVAVILLILAAVTGLIIASLTPEEKSLLLDLVRNNGVYLLAAVILLLAGIGFALDGIFHVYILPIGRMSEEAELIFNVNPTHRLRPEGSTDLVRLAEAINKAAERFEEQEDVIDCRIRDAKVDTEEEKNILAAVISELPEGVLICNIEGQILLYNRQARHLLIGDLFDDDPTAWSGSRPVGPKDAFIGLGRSLFGLIDKNIVVHALEEIAAKLGRNEPNVISSFVVVGRQNNLLRAEAAPIVNPVKNLTGFILTLSDITEKLDADSRTYGRLQSLATGLRASLAGIRSAAEVLLEFPQMEADHLERFKWIIHKEAIALENIVEEMGAVASQQMTTRWPLVPMAATELAEAVCRRAADSLGLHVELGAREEDTWVKVDSYSLVLALLFVLDQLQKEKNCRAYRCSLRRVGGYLNFDLSWRGTPVKIEILRQWDKRVLSVGSEALHLTLKQVLLHHSAEIWSHSESSSPGIAVLRLFLPVLESTAQEKVRNIMILPESRPEFYDFDLFHQPGQNPDLDSRLLSDLTYTVFDTETTGLDPRGGDEIISIGAVRIVNGRLLREDCFDQLIDPQRPLPPESTAIHGITPEMLEGQPVIGTVLPLFHRFTEDTILLAHNAAFDMRMLQVKEADTGVRFINPVLDTLLLSAVVHPAQDDHNLEAIARRTGISVMGRHTALGDAIVTGEMFLKLLPLLAEKGVRTLKEARLASEKTYYARLKY
jgi:DNA polymerase-3 subunit epsilon